MTEQQRIDQESRDAILTQTDENFFVEAGAGSGKTTMLVSRLVAMVESGVDIRKICTITYTKAAAAEFYGRFRTLLQKRSREDYVPEQVGAGHLSAPTEQTRQYCREALTNIDLCFMGTIDSFCKMVLSEHPSEANIPSDMVLLDDSEQMVFLSGVFQNILIGVYDEKAPGLSSKAKEFKKLQSNASDAFAVGMQFLMKNRGVDFQYPPEEIDTIEQDVESLKAAIACLKKHQNEIQQSSLETDIAAWNKLEMRGPEILDGSLSDRLWAIKDLNGVRLRKGTDVNAYPRLLTWFEDTGGRKICGWNDKLKALKNKLDTQKYCFCLDFLRSCCEIAESEMRLNGYITFSDTLFYLRNMLKESAENGGELIQYIRRRHRFFLVDEFQDTNPIQGEILFYLSSNTPAGRWTECIPEQGSLFMVGDPKQSIYRFSGADVSSYLRIKTLFDRSTWGQVRQLPNNFRSTGTLKRYFNEVFSKCMSSENTEQRKFEEIPIREEDKKTDGDCSGVWIYELSREREEKNSDVILQLIQSLVENEKYAFVHKKGEEPKPITYGDIMVITRGKRVLSSYVRTLNEAGVPTWVEGGVPYQTNRALLLAANLFSALVNYEDKASLYGVLTSCLYGFKDEDLIKFRYDNGPIQLNRKVSESQESVCPLEKALNDLAVFSYSIRNLSPVAAFSSILDTYKVFEAENPKDLEMVYDVLEQLKQAVIDGKVVTLKTAANYVLDLIWDGDRERCLRFSQNGNCVHLANLHKVKGLEAPVVILAPALKKAHSPSARIERNEDGSVTGYWFNCKKSFSDSSMFETKAFSEKMELETNSEGYEKIRLEYVAATRARNMLIIFEKVNRDQSSGSYWCELLPQDRKQFPRETNNKQPDTKEEVSISELYEQHEDLNHIDAETESFSIENPSRTKLSSKLKESEVEDRIETDLEVCGEVHEYPTVWGTMVHRVMELLVSTDNAIQTDELVSLVWNELSVMEIEEKKDDFTKALTNVCDTIKHGGYGQLNDCPKDILTELLSAEECLCEVPFCCKIDDTVWNGIMDVIYKKDGIWHIVDYKTDKNGENLDSVHRGQLEAYKQAFYATTGEKATDAKIYHIAE